MFTAWPTYEANCRGRPSELVKNGIAVANGSAVETATMLKMIVEPTPTISRPENPGKVCERCELARELYKTHNFPLEQIPTRICIVQHASKYNTSTVGRLNADGSRDYGLF